MRRAAIASFFLWSGLALAQTGPEKFHALMESTFAEHLAEDPELATTLLGRGPADDSR